MNITIRSTGIPRLVLAVSLISVPAVAQSDGDLDPRYGDAGFASLDFTGETNVSMQSVACGPEGRCNTAGWFGSPNYDFLWVSWNAAGTAAGGVGLPIDLGGSLRDRAYDVAVQPDGKVLLAGCAADSAMLSDERRMAVLRMDGSLPDSDFGIDGVATVNFTGDSCAHALAIAPDGKIVLAGFYETNGANGADIAIVRLLANGDPDNGFDGNGVRTVGFDLGNTKDDLAYGVAVQRDGKVVAVGRAQLGPTDSDFALVRLNANGTPDESFGPGGKVLISFDLAGGNAEDEADAIAIDRFGRIVVAGFAQSSTGPRVAVARRTAAGLIDTAFDGDGKLTIETMFGAQDVELTSWPRERILLDWGFGMHALLPGGAPDPTFGAGGFIVYENPDWDFFGSFGMTLLGGQPVVAGYGFDSPPPTEHLVARYWMDQIFGDNFESGNRNAWSLVP